LVRKYFLIIPFYVVFGGNEKRQSTSEVSSNILWHKTSPLTPLLLRGELSELKKPLLNRRRGWG